MRLECPYKTHSLPRQGKHLIIDVLQRRTFCNAARYEKVRHAGRIVSRAVLVVAGVNDDGHRELLTWRLGDSESEQTWGEVFGELKRRGLGGVELVVSERTERLLDVIEGGRAGGAVNERLQKLETLREGVQDKIRAIDKERQEATNGIKRIEFLPLLKRLIAESAETPQPAIVRTLVGEIRLGFGSLEMNLTLNRFALTCNVAGEAGLEPAAS